MKKLLKRDITKKQLLIFSAVAVLLRLAMTALQRTTLMPESTVLDDALMYNAAVHIQNGEWLGPYNFLTMGKHMFFSVWLAFLHTLGIPYLLAGHILSVFSCVVLVVALSPAIKSNIVRLALLAALIFCPALYADYTLRVYRDNITTSFFLLVFACVIGIALRYKREKTGAVWAFAIGGGLSLGISYLLREDGYWLLPFVVAGVAVTIVFLFKNKAAQKGVKIAAMGSLFVVAVACIMMYCGMNYRYYGRFIVSDFTSADFKAAYGALTRIDISEDGNMIVPVDYETRQLLYAASPAFAELEPYLEDPEVQRFWRKDVGDGVQEFSGGGFYWGVRNAAQLAGHYENAQTAEAYYLLLAQELNDAYDSGLLPAATGRRSALNTPLTARYIGPTLREVGASLYYVVTYQDIDCSPPLSTGPYVLLEEIEAYTRTDAMIPVRVYNDEYRVVLWATKIDSQIQVVVMDSAGNLLPADVHITTGGDVYALLLNDGVTLKYPNGIRYIVTYDPQDTDAAVAILEGEEILFPPQQEMAQYAQSHGVYYQVEYVGASYEEEVVHGTLELWLYRGMRLVVWGYRILSPVALLAALAALVLTILRAAKNRKTGECRGDALLGWITAGVGLSALLRVGMVAFVETSAFGIGTNPMYLSAVYPLGILFCFLCYALWLNTVPAQEGDDGENLR